VLRQAEKIAEQGVIKEHGMETGSTGEMLKESRLVSTGKVGYKFYRWSAVQCHGLSMASSSLA